MATTQRPAAEDDARPRGPGESRIGAYHSAYHRRRGPARFREPPRRPHSGARRRPGRPPVIGPTGNPSRSRATHGTPPDRCDRRVWPDGSSGGFASYRRHPLLKSTRSSRESLVTTFSTRSRKTGRFVQFYLTTGARIPEVGDMRGAGHSRSPALVGGNRQWQGTRLSLASLRRSC